jgi:hypothetical protein
MKRTLVAWLVCAFIALPAGASAQQTMDATKALSTNVNDPLAITSLTLAGVPSRQAIRVCFAFMNLTALPVTSAKFHFAVVDQFGSQVLGADLVRNARSSFAPGQTVNPPDTSQAGFSDTNDGSQSCWLVPVTAEGIRQLQTVSNGGKLAITVLALSFSGGQVWQQGETFARAFNHDGTAHLVQFDTTWSTSADAAPVAITAAGIESTSGLGGGPRMQQCVSFRNITNKIATGVTLGYVFSDAAGTPLPNALNWHNTFTGTFTPPILIENKCWTADLPAESVVHRMRHENVVVRGVTFADGSQWSQGTQYLKAFDNDGNHFSGPQPVVAAVAPAGSSAAAPSNAAPSQYIGGSIGPSAQQFGEIAWVKGSLTAFGFAVDKATAFDAQYEAMSACRAHAGASSGSCELLLNGRALNSPATRCVQLLVSGNVFAVGKGETQDAADLDAINSLRANGGSIDQAHSLVKACNSH